MKSNPRRVFVISIIVICIVAINLGVFFQIIKTDTKENKKSINIDVAKLTEDFSEIFNNSIDYQGTNLNIQKADIKKELVCVDYSKKQTLENYYEIEVNIPKINIDSENANKINKEIKSLFQEKATSILSKRDIQYIYNVKYKAYLNDNILSLAIMSTLKEGNNSQRVIVKTYNYNITSNEIMTLNQLLDYRNIDSKNAQAKINEVIKNASDKAETYQDLGYNKLLRNKDDSMYKIENANVFFLGHGQAMYILYPYGNSSYTSEIDIVVM